MKRRLREKLEKEKALGSDDLLMRLKSFMDVNKYSQAEMAKHLQCRHETISRWFVGKRRVSGVYRRLIEAFLVQTI